MTTTVRDIIDATPLPDGAQAAFPHTPTDRLRHVWFLITHTPQHSDAALDSDSESVDLNGTAGEAHEDGEEPYGYFRAVSWLPDGIADLATSDSIGGLEDAAVIYQALAQWSFTEFLPKFSASIVTPEDDPGSTNVGVYISPLGMNLMENAATRRSTLNPDVSGPLAALGWALYAYQAWERTSRVADEYLTGAVA